jgi:hypothetical protein
MTIPVHSFETGEILGHQGRAVYPGWNGPKYILVAMRQRDACIHDPYDSNIPVLTEGMFDTFETPGAICTLGCQMTPALLNSVRNRWQHVTWAYDADKAGYEAVLKFAIVGDTWRQYNEGGEPSEHTTVREHKVVDIIDNPAFRCFDKYTQDNAKKGYALLNCIEYCEVAFPLLQIKELYQKVLLDPSEENVQALLKEWKKTGAYVRRRDQ